MGEINYERNVNWKKIKTMREREENKWEKMWEKCKEKRGKENMTDM